MILSIIAAYHRSYHLLWPLRLR